MGNEESKRYEEKSNILRQQGMSRDEVKRLLEQQRREYDRKLQQLNERSAASAATAAATTTAAKKTNVPANKPVRTAREANNEYLDQLIGQQVQEFVQIAYNSPANTATQRFGNQPSQTHLPGRSATEAGPSTSTNTGIERNRNPYSFTKKALQTRQNPNTHQNLDSYFLNIERDRDPYSFNKETLQTRQSPISPQNLDNRVINTERDRNPYNFTKEALQTRQNPKTRQNLDNNFFSIERNRNPYSFTKEALQTRQSPQTPQNLYPNLDAVNANLPSPAAPPATKSTPTFRQGLNNSRGSGEFVFVNNNAQGVQPSAPPLPTTVTGAVRKQFYKPKSSPRNRDDEQQFNCKTCGNKYGLSIYQCSLGHSSCSDCKVRGKQCGVCRQPIGDTKNYSLESIIAERKTKCPNHADGCLLLLKTADIENHLKECPFREFTCPLFAIFGHFEKCRWRGKISQIVSHFDDVHSEHRQANVDTEMVLLNILDNNHIIHLIDLSPFIFIVHIKVVDNDRKIYVAVQLMGTQISASKWTYELHIYNKREPRRKFLHTDICYSNATPLQEIFQESKCAVIPQSYAMGFINEGCLNYKFYIKKDGENNQNDAPSSSRGKWRGGGRGRGGRGRGAKSWSSQNNNA